MKKRMKLTAGITLINKNCKKYMLNFNQKFKKLIFGLFLGKNGSLTYIFR